MADLMVQFPDGHQVAIEVQYSAQTVSRWRQRHQSYRDRQVHDVWLLGNRSPHLVDEGRQQRVVLTDMHRAVLHAGLPLLWVNPDRRIATATATSTGFTLAPTASAYEVEYRVDPIEDCRLTSGGLITPTMNLIADQRTKWEAHQARQHRSREAAQATAAAQQKRHRASVETAKEHRAKHEAIWVTSPLRAELLARHGQLTAPITDSPRPDNGVFAAPQHWHAIIYRDLLHDRVGSAFTVRDVYRALANQQIKLHPDRRKPAATIVAYLDRLHQLGLISIVRNPANPRWIRDCTVLMDLDSYDRFVAAECERARKALAEQQAAAKFQADAEAVHRANQAAARSRWDYPLPEHDGNIGRVRNYVPGTNPVLRWHQVVISAIRDPDGPHLAPYPDDLRDELREQLQSVPDDALDRFLVTYRNTVAPDVRARSNN